MNAAMGHNPLASILIDDDTEQPSGSLATVKASESTAVRAKTIGKDVLGSVPKLNENLATKMLSLRMPESMVKAFGRFAIDLKEERGLTKDQVGAAAIFQILQNNRPDLVEQFDCQGAMDHVLSVRR